VHGERRRARPQILTLEDDTPVLAIDPETAT
jgi:hypothetical protein